MEKKTRKKSQLSKGFDKFNIIAIVIVVIIILFAVGFGITKIVYKPNKSSEIGDYNKNIVEDVKQVTMPKIAGETKANAVNKLEQMKLKVEIIEEYSKVFAPGYVMEQSIEPGEKILEGATVKLIVSKELKTNTNQITMPNVIGETKANAVNKLEQMNLKVKVIEKTSQTIAPGCVIKQSINSGVIIDEKTTITLVVSKGEK